MDRATWGTPGKLLKADEAFPLGARGAPVKEGPLGMLIRQVMQEPRREHWRYSVVMQGRPLLGAVDIRLLAARPDYPQI